MGLGFSHGDAHWAYSGFDRFRVKLAREIGINLDLMDGFCEKGGISWSKVKDDIVPLLNHSDCDGELTVEECKKIWPRLKELIKDWEEGNRDKRGAYRLIEGMKEAIKMNEPLEFG